MFPSVKPNTMEMIASWKSPRFIRSHLPMHMLPIGLWTIKPKIIYVTRDPKDTAVSLYHHMKGLGISSTLEEDVNKIFEDRSCYGPLWQHVLEFWSIRNEPNVFFTSFEKMKKDLRAVVEQIAKLLQVEINDEKMERFLEYLSFDKMKNNPACGHIKETEEIREVFGVEKIPFRFIRKGQVGSYKTELSEGTIRKFEKWTEGNLSQYGVTLHDILLK